MDQHQIDWSSDEQTLPSNNPANMAHHSADFLSLTVQMNGESSSGLSTLIDSIVIKKGWPYEAIHLDMYGNTCSDEIAQHFPHNDSTELHRNFSAGQSCLKRSFNGTANGRVHFASSQPISMSDSICIKPKAKISRWSPKCELPFIDDHQLTDYQFMNNLIPLLDQVSEINDHYLLTS